MGMFDNPLLKKMAFSALAKHFKESDTKAILIYQDANGEFEFKSFAARVTVISETAYLNLLNNQKNETTQSNNDDAATSNADADNAAK